MEAIACYNILIKTIILRSNLGGLMLEIGNRIKRFREEKNLTQQELADMIFKSKSSIEKYESGSSNVTLSALLDISKALNIAPSALLDDEQDILNTIVKYYGLEDKENYNIEKDFELLMKVLAERYKKQTK